MQTMGDDKPNGIASLPSRKRLKLSDLPLGSGKRADIESLVQKMKKKGYFDSLRKQGYQRFESGDPKSTLLSSLEHLVDTETDRDSSLLAKDRRIAASLIEGTAERSEVYRVAEDSVNLFVQELLVEAEQHLRGIRRSDIGEDAAARELKRGDKTEEDWAEEANARHVARVQALEDEKERQRRKEREERKRAEEERRRRKEEDEARERERLEREERRRAEREAERERDRERERKKREEYEKEKEEYERARTERRERRRRKEREREEEYERERERERERRRRSSIKKAPEQETDLEEAALMELLKEGQEAAKSRQRPELERSEDLEPPPSRKTLVPKSIRPRDPISARLAKLDKPPAKTAGAEAAAAAATTDASPTAEPTLQNKSDAAKDEGEIDSSKPSASSPPDNNTRAQPTRDERASEYRITSRYDDRPPPDHSSRRASIRYDDIATAKEPDRASQRDRSCSPDRPAHRDSRRAAARSRSPLRHPVRRSRSPRRRRDRSTPPPGPGIDRYVPGGDRRRDRSADSRRDRARDDDRWNRDRRRGGRDERGGRDDDRRRERERPGDKRDDDRPRYVEIDRYVPGRAAAAKRRRSQSRERERDRDQPRERDRERDDARRRNRSRSASSR